MAQIGKRLIMQIPSDAATLAKADLWASGLAALRVGAAGFIVPFMFTLNKTDGVLLLAIGDWERVVLATALLAAVLLALAVTATLLCLRRVEAGLGSPGAVADG